MEAAWTPVPKTAETWLDKFPACIPAGMNFEDWLLGLFVFCNKLQHETLCQEHNISVLGELMHGYDTYRSALEIIEQWLEELIAP